MPGKAVAAWEPGGWGWPEVAWVFALLPADPSPGGASFLTDEHRILCLHTTVLSKKAWPGHLGKDVPKQV